MNIHQVAMGCKPDPYNFTIVWQDVVNGNTIILANYHGCLTFGGNKLMLLKGIVEVTDTLDPHFLDEEYPVVARFIPTKEGLRLAELCAKSLSTGQIEDYSLPPGVHQRPGFSGYGVQLYRIEGSCLGEMEAPIGYGPTLKDAIQNAIENGHIKEENL